MVLRKIVILALCLLVVRTCTARCRNSTDLEETMRRIFQRQGSWPPDTQSSADSSVSCPLDLYQKLPSMADKDRSLSPWKWVTVTRPDYFPHTYTEAKCLCSGCILVLKNGTVIESPDYNSKPLVHAFLFLKRVRDNCKEGMYRLVREKMEVSVGCTCVRANTVGS
ncbi:interleukin-17C [Fundulus diaphanus]